MSSLPVISGKGVVKVFGSLGWRMVRQSSSHIILTKEGEIATSQFQIIRKLPEGRYEV